MQVNNITMGENKNNSIINWHRYFVATAFLILLSFQSLAQSADSSSMPKPNNQMWQKLPSKQTTHHIVQYSGAQYNADELMRMPARNINKIAATVAGVESRNGETPIIRGAQGGTAYFIDGVRVYGALPAMIVW